MTATLVNATLSYQLSLTNHTTAPLAGVSVVGDMVAAHASRPASELLSVDGHPLPPLHRINMLHPGESVTLKGELRLPLSAITPIFRGEAALFVPLARLRAEGMAESGERVSSGGTFLVGQTAPQAKLSPFRLDLGPRLYQHLGQRLLPSGA